MSSVTHSLFRMFRGGGPATAEAESHTSAPRVQRRSSGLNEFLRGIAGQEGLTILDLGSTSAANLSRLTAMGHRVYTEDVVRAASDPSLMTKGEDGKPILDVARFLRENLAYQGQIFDAVLCWDSADYLPESLVKPVIERLCSVMRPGSTMLAFFHTKDAGPDAPYYRYHIAANEILDLQPVTQSGRSGGPLFRLQRVFNNRHIENLFREFASLKFFLARDNIREVLVVR